MCVCVVGGAGGQEWNGAGQCVWEVDGAGWGLCVCWMELAFVCFVDGVRQGVCVVGGAGWVGCGCESGVDGAGTGMEEPRVRDEGVSGG